MSVLYLRICASAHPCSRADERRRSTSRASLDVARRPLNHAIRIYIYIYIHKCICMYVYIYIYIYM